MSQNESDLEQAAERPVPAFSFPFSPEVYAPQKRDGKPYDPNAARGDRHHQGRFSQPRGSRRSMGKR